MNINEIISNPVTKIIAIKILTGVAAGSFCASAVSFSCKINHIKYRWLFCILCFFITPLTPFFFIFRKVFKTEVPFVCSKCGKRAPKDRKVCKKCGCERFITFQVENYGEVKNKIIISIVVAVIIYAAGYWAVNYSPLAEEVNEPSSQEEFDDYEEDEAEFVEDASLGLLL